MEQLMCNGCLCHEILVVNRRFQRPAENVTVSLVSYSYYCQEGLYLPLSPTLVATEPEILSTEFHYDTSSLPRS